MEQVLANKLYSFILRNNPDLMIRENDAGIKEIIRTKLENVIPVLENQPCVKLPCQSSSNAY